MVLEPLRISVLLAFANLTQTASFTYENSPKHYCDSLFYQTTTDVNLPGANPLCCCVFFQFKLIIPNYGVTIT